MLPNAQQHIHRDSSQLKRHQDSQSINPRVPSMILAAILLFTQVASAVFFCPESDRVAVQDYESSMESGGCVKPFVPARDVEDFGYCCDIHDVCYQTCGMERSYCDKEYRKATRFSNTLCHHQLIGSCMTGLCNSIYNGTSECMKEAEKFAKKVEKFNAVKYKQAQATHCKCVAKDKALNHWISAIDKFYKTYAPNKAGDFFREKHDVYVSNTGSKEKPAYGNMAQLYFELHAQYDHVAIKHVGARIDRNPPRPPEKRFQMPGDDDTLGSATEEL